MTPITVTSKSKYNRKRYVLVGLSIGIVAFMFSWRLLFTDESTANNVERSPLITKYGKNVDALGSRGTAPQDYLNVDGSVEQYEDEMKELSNNEIVNQVVGEDGRIIKNLGEEPFTGPVLGPPPRRQRK